MVEVHFETVPQRPDSVLVVQFFNAALSGYIIPNAGGS